MTRLRIRAPDAAAPTIVTVENDEVTIGRSPQNEVVIAHPTVSSRHARLYRESGRWMIVEIKSTNGTFVNGARVTEAVPVGASDRLELGTVVVEIAESTTEAPRPAAAPARSAPAPVPSPAPAAEPTPDTRPPESAPDARREIKDKIHRKLIEFLDFRWVDLSKLDDDALRSETRGAIENILRDLAWEVPPGLDRESLIKQVLDEALGLGPLEDLLADPAVSEIMVNRADQIYVERGGKLTLSDRHFNGDRAVLAAIERIVAPLGRRIDQSSPMVDARLKDGSRVNAIIPPLAIKGPCLTIRKFSKKPLGPDDLVRFGAMTRGMVRFLEQCVEMRKNVVVSGGTGSGKTTLLNLLSGFVPHDERVITVEDSAELRLVQDHVVSLETRPPNLEGTGEVKIRDLVKNALRMRPDRIVVGECRGGEALDMLQAMNTGHDGSMTTLHANAPRDALARLETLVLMAGMDLPVRAIREQIASAVHFILQQTRFADGSRKVTAISEVLGIEDDQIQLQDVFYFKEDGFDGDGKIRGRHLATGYIPRFYEDLRRRGRETDLSIFRES